jgi:hypothetical protein
MYDLHHASQKLFSCFACLDWFHCLRFVRLAKLKQFGWRKGVHLLQQLHWQRVFVTWRVISKPILLRYRLHYLFGNPRKHRVFQEPIDKLCQLTCMAFIYQMIHYQMTRWRGYKLKEKVERAHQSPMKVESIVWPFRELQQQRQWNPRRGVCKWIINVNLGTNFCDHLLCRSESKTWQACHRHCQRCWWKLRFSLPAAKLESCEKQLSAGWDHFKIVTFKIVTLDIYCI